MTPRLRKLLLTTHIILSVSWIGAVAAFLVLAIAGLSNLPDDKLRACYFAMNMIAWYAILPLSLTALIIGIFQSLVTPWGLFRHYWVSVKLFLTIFSTAILSVKMRLISHLAEMADKNLLSDPNLRQGKRELVVHAAGGLAVLIYITGISIFKPWGKTNFSKDVEGKPCE